MQSILYDGGGIWDLLDGVGLISSDWKMSCNADCTNALPGPEKNIRRASTCQSGDFKLLSLTKFHSTLNVWQVLRNYVLCNNTSYCNRMTE